MTDDEAIETVKRIGLPDPGCEHCGWGHKPCLCSLREQSREAAAALEAQPPEGKVDRFLRRIVEFTT